MNKNNSTQKNHYSTTGQYSVQFPHNVPRQTMNDAGPPRTSQMGGFSNSQPYGNSLRPISGSSTQEVVTVPDELSSWARGQLIHAVLLKVKEQSGINRIQPSMASDSSVISLLIDSPTADRAEIARKLLDMHFKQQIKLMKTESRLQQTQNSLLEVQGEMAAGTRIEFQVPVDLVGVIIGKKGVRVKEIQSQTNVNVNIDGETGYVSIFGSDSASVQRAREMLDIIEETVELKPEAVEWLSRDTSNLVDLKETSGVLIARLDRQAEQIHFVGTHSAVYSAQLVLNTQLEYMETQLKMRMAERETYEKVQNIKRKFGMGGRGGAGGAGGRGGRGDEDLTRRVNVGYGNNGGRGGMNRGRSASTTAVDDSLITKPKSVLTSNITSTRNNSSMGTEALGSGRVVSQVAVGGNIDKVGREQSSGGGREGGQNATRNERGGGGGGGGGAFTRSIIVEERVTATSTSHSINSNNNNGNGNNRSEMRMNNSATNTQPAVSNRAASALQANVNSNRNEKHSSVGESWPKPPPTTTTAKGKQTEASPPAAPVTSIVRDSNSSTAPPHPPETRHGKDKENGGDARKAPAGPPSAAKKNDSDRKEGSRSEAPVGTPSGAASGGSGGTSGGIMAAVSAQKRRAKASPRRQQHELQAQADSHVDGITAGAGAGATAQSKPQRNNSTPATASVDRKAAETPGKGSIASTPIPAVAAVVKAPATLPTPKTISRIVTLEPGDDTLASVTTSNEHIPLPKRAPGNGRQSRKRDGQGGLAGSLREAMESANLINNT